LSSTTEQFEAHHVTSINPWIIAATVMLATFMELLDTSIANVSLPHIARNLSAGVDQSTWILTSYLVSNAIVLPLTGWFSKLIGRKRFFMCCTVMFTLSSLLCGLAPSLPLLVFFRVLQGAGGGGMQPAAQAILIDSFPRKKHGMAMAIYAAGALVAPAIGPTIGGWITDSYTWRWIFLINIPIGILSIALSSFVLSDPPNAAKQPGSFRQIDYIGLSLLSIGLGFTQVVLDKGQREDWFHSHFIVVMSAIAAAALITLVWWEFKVANPVVELHLLLDRNFFVSTSLIFLIGFILYGTVVLLPILLQTVVGFTAENSGLVLLPGGIAGLLTLPLIGKILSKVDPRRLIFIGLIILPSACSSFLTSVSIRPCARPPATGLFHASPLRSCSFRSTSWPLDTCRATKPIKPAASSIFRATSAAAWAFPSSPPCSTRVPPIIWEFWAEQPAPRQVWRVARPSQTRLPRKPSAKRRCSCTRDSIARRWRFPSSTASASSPPWLSW